YWPNDYGLYNMAGNVNEWVQDVYRPLSPDDVDSFNPYRGNVFTDLRRDANGNVVGKDNLGRLYIDTVKPADVADRYNYQKGDYRNYRDGDLKSAIGVGGTWTSPEDAMDTGKMYSQTADDFSTLVNDNSRVIKGGSWKDRAYWLNPSTRRYLDQESARDDIGFRCAMIRVGSPAGF
ncbi:MAG: SUMF1/EgtB/PvdO family nonheme iron enzyme, partial [Bacteroidales bacterium]|nr:SUMF1/EgtB/PvdO family nonheme iron enzyme [Bacteroidales bacterium]